MATRVFCATLALFLLARCGECLDNGVGLTPAMGYNTWDDFRCGGINSTNVMKVADAIVRYGLDKVGYQYLGLDDCWATSRDEQTGVIVPDPKAFPDGMKAVADYVHGKNLKFGIYTDRGTATCVGRPGSQGYESIDAKTYADWGVDLVKEDSCSAPTDHNASFAQYALMRDALNATGRPIYFALCGWSAWYAPVGATLGNSWRYGYDVNDWNSAYSNSIASASSVASDAGPGGWNDPDALIGTSTSTAVHMTQKQSRTQMSLWAMMAAPLEIGSNILNMNEYDLETYMNQEVIAIDQDPAGKQGSVFSQSEKCTMRSSESGVATNILGVAMDAWTGMTARRRRKQWEATAADEDRESVTGTCTALPDCQQIWTRNLSNGDVAVTFVNYTQTLSSEPNLQGRQSFHTGAGGSSGGSHMALVTCDASQLDQLWQLGATTTSGGMTTVKSMGSSKSCWEINGCGYRPGSGVDTSFGCKSLPAQGVTDPCCSNMAWIVDEKTKAITSAWNTSLCFQLKSSSSGGGELAACDGSTEQQWTLKKQQHASDSNGTASYQIISANTGQCITDVSNSQANLTYHDAVRGTRTTSQYPASGGTVASGNSLVFDVKASLGWQNGAKVRDLWSKRDLGTMMTIRGQLTGDGDSSMYRLTKA